MRQSLRSPVFEQQTLEENVREEIDGDRLRLNVSELEKNGVPTDVIAQLRQMGDVGATEDGAFVNIAAAGFVAWLVTSLAVGTISTFIFTSILDIVGVAPWQE